MAHTVGLVWVASTDTVDGYNVYRGVAAGQELTKLNSSTLTGTSFTDSTPLGGHDFYEVKSVLGGVESVASNEVSVIVPPAPPTQLVATLN
jgi:hypothetical protein